MGELWDVIINGGGGGVGGLQNGRGGANEVLPLQKWEVNKF